MCWCGPTSISWSREFAAAACGPWTERFKSASRRSFQPTSDFYGGEPIADRDPDAFLIDEQHTLDLTEAVRQYREVSAEMQPLCRPDCRGLCPVCGRDLNQGECNCDRSAHDDRWAALGELRGATASGKD